MATLMDVGWHAPKATEWSRAVGADEDMAEQWDIPSVLDDSFKATGCFQPLIDDFETDIIKQLCEKAALHVDGQGLQHGADVWQIRAEQTIFEKKGQLDMVGLNIMVVAGGQWNKTRATDSGYLLTSKI